MPDRVAEAAAELYAADPDSFTERRTALAAASKSAGDAGAAKQIAALRKPTRAAWVVNQLVRADPQVSSRLAGLTESLQAAQRSRDGQRLRELSAERGALLDELTRQALAVVDLLDPPVALRDDVTATLGAALADPVVAEQLAAGTLTKAAHWAGFGFGPMQDQPDLAAPAPAAPTAPARKAPTRKAQGARAPRTQSGRTSPRVPATGRRAESPAQAEVGAAARRRASIQDAERNVANATAKADAAAAEEDQLEDTVRDLERRLTRAREQLADVRRRARAAESAERKARQALDRLRRESLSGGTRDRGCRWSAAPRPPRIRMLEWHGSDLYRIW